MRHEIAGFACQPPHALAFAANDNRERALEVERVEILFDIAGQANQPYAAILHLLDAFVGHEDAVLDRTDTGPDRLFDAGRGLRVRHDRNAGRFRLGDQCGQFLGPVVAVLPFEDEADAVRIANDTPYGLSGSIWTTAVGRAIRVARAVEAGNLSVNSHSSVRYWTPFGGFKQSGLGRELGPDAPDSFTEVKNVFIAAPE